MKNNNFKFHGGAGSYVGTAILAGILTIFTLGIAYPWALVMMEKWRVENVSLNGQRLKFTGTGLGLFGIWIKILILSFITLGIYLLWAVPVLQKWIWSNTTLEE